MSTVTQNGGTGPNLTCFTSTGTPPTGTMSAGAAPGTNSRSSVCLSAGNGIQNLAFFITDAGNANTATWGGSCVMRFNITTANSNITWSSLEWCEKSALSSSSVTQTSGLAIGLGTTGVKTASVDVVAYTIKSLGVSAQVHLAIVGTNVATMTATFNWLPDQDVTLPFTASAGPASVFVPSIPLTGAGF